MHKFHVTSSNALLCASMCATNANCETYYYDASQCHEASASSLERATSNLLTAKYAYIDQNVYRSKKGLTYFRRQWTICVKTKFQLTVYGIGDLGQHAQQHVEQELAPDRQTPVSDHFMLGSHVVAAE